MPPCTETDRLDLAFDAAEADPPLPAALEGHARGCPDCRRRLAELREQQGLLQRLRHVQRLPRPRGPDAPNPDRIGAYVILQRLAAGGMGVVYLAEQTSPRRTVALKVVRPDLLTPRARRRFEREVQFLGRLDHAGIARILEAGVATTAQGEQPYFAMEWVRGERLLDHARGRRLDARARVRLALEVCEALRYAHQRGVLHRDLKPGNVMVDEHGRTRLLDFGIARSLEDGGAGAATTDDPWRGIPGTLVYMSPEQARGDVDAVDVRSDVYSFGVLLFELLAGVLPHEPAEHDRFETLRRICDEPPRRPSRWVPALRGDLEAILLHAVEKQPARRYPSIDALASDLHAWLEHRPTRARPPTPLGTLVRWARREPWKATVAGAGALLLLALASAQVLGLAVARRSEIEAGQAQRVRQQLESALEQGFLALATSEEDAARAAFEAALGLAPDEPEALAGLALALRRLGRADEALARLGAVPSALRGVPSLRRVEADLLRALGREEAAGAALQGLGPPLTPVERFVEASRLIIVPGPLPAPEADRRAARELLEQAVLAAPTARLLYHATMARVVASVGSDGDRERLATALGELWPDSAFAWFWTAYMFHNHDARRAAEAYRRAVELDPVLSPAWTNLGLVLRDLGELTAAREAQERAVAVAPGNISAWNNLGTTRVDLGEHEAAEQAFAQAARLDPDYVLAWNGLATARDRRGDRDGALAAARRAIELRPELGGGWYNLGVLLDDGGQTEEALQAYERALAAEPGHWRAHGRRCRILRKIGPRQALAEAVAAWRASLHEDAAAWNVHAVFLMSAADPLDQDLPAALQAAEKAVALSPYPHPLRQSTLAMALFVNGRAQEAIDTLTRALAVFDESGSSDAAARALLQDQLAAFRNAAPAGGEQSRGAPPGDEADVPDVTADG